MSDCQIWTGALRNGYPCRRVGGRAGKTIYVHREICKAVHGPAPPGKPLALHTCNTRSCYNAEHLYWGDKTDNAEDSRIDGTMAIGEKHGGAKLTREQVQEIRASQMSSYQIAPIYGIAASTVRGLRNRSGNWKWLTHL